MSLYADGVDVLVDATRQAVVQRGKRLEYFTIAWNSLEGVIAIVAGAIAGSISLVGFGIDSFIEVTSGATRFGECMLTATRRSENVTNILA